MGTLAVAQDIQEGLLVQSTVLVPGIMLTLPLSFPLLLFRLRGLPGLVAPPVRLVRPRRLRQLYPPLRSGARGLRKVFLGDGVGPQRGIWLREAQMGEPARNQVVKPKLGRRRLEMILTGHELRPGGVRGLGRRRGPVVRRAPDGGVVLGAVVLRSAANAARRRTRRTRQT
ncbi:hypothetical protein Tdes44962_MAKER08125 [Teratosphaeria destructans]|uniref:Uncharacterized protein n=1 Tax=Teratosphaeria destructans TaxID=418781 RepID=A0A9W7SXH5_9PEZI|nr:hypothetical protein Tdes44962_MAKER08125 [Teratosphaeria destructans]